MDGLLALTRPVQGARDQPKIILDAHLRAPATQSVPACHPTPRSDSKLTRVLQDSLGGNAKTSLIVAVSDAYEHVEESVQSLAFGMRAMRVTTQVKRLG